MTAVTPEAVSAQTIEPRLGFLARRLADLLVQIRELAGDDLEVTFARAVDDAFASIARDYRR